MERIVSMALALACVVSSVNAEEVTWEKLPSLVKERNGKVVGAKNKTLAAEALTGHLIRSFQPRIDAVGGYEKAKQGTRADYSQPYYGIEGRINLIASGKDQQEAHIREARALLSEASAKMKESDILHQARKLYLDWVLNRDIEQSLRNAKKENEAGKRSALRRIDRGVGTTTDRLEFDLNESEMKQELESVLHEKWIIQILLAALVNVEKPEVLNILGTLEHEHDDALLGDLSREVSQTPEIRMANASQGEALAVARQSARWWTPQVDLIAGHYLHTEREREFADRAERKESVLGIELKFTLWDGPAFAASRSKSFFEKAQTIEEVQAQRDTAASIRAHQEEMKHAHEIVHSLENRKTLTATYLKQSLSEYERGVKRSPEILSSFQRSLKLEQDLLRANYAYRLAQAELLRELGN